MPTKMSFKIKKKQQHKLIKIHQIHTQNNGPKYVKGTSENFKTTNLSVDKYIL